MAKFKKLLEQARNNPKGVRYRDLCKLAELAGFSKTRQRGSHAIYRHPGNNEDFDGSSLSLQEGKNGKAKAYQVNQLVALIDDHELTGNSAEEDHDE